MRIINTEATIRQLTGFIKNTVTTAGFHKVIVAVSGGVDSATSASLAVRSLGSKHVYGFLLPYRDAHDQAVVDARNVLQQLNVPEENVFQVNIGSMVDCLSNELRLTQGATDRVRRGNVMARVRMIALYDVAKKLPALVVGTENKSEHLLGYFTRFGDEASDLEPLRGLYKTEVYQVARSLGVPAAIIDKSPTAGLWPGQTDEGQFGFTYAEADEILWSLFDQKNTPENIVAQGFDQKIVTRVAQWVKNNDFKQHVPHIAPEPVLK